MPTDRFGPLARALFRGFLEMSTKLHLAEDAFTLHLLLQGSQRLIDIVVAYNYLHRFSPNLSSNLVGLTGAGACCATVSQ